MAVGDLNDGSKFGLPAIGLPQSTLDTPGSDTERRSFPGLATKSSVFAWTSDMPLLASSGVPVANTTLNLRTVVDVPVWASGCLVKFTFTITTMGTSTYHTFSALSAQTVFPSGGVIWEDSRGATTPGGSIVAQVIVPFYDEPIIRYAWGTDGNGTGAFNIILLGFVRNV